MAGDRWTLLILRELLGGPARFEELVKHLTTGLSPAAIQHVVETQQGDRGDGCFIVFDGTLKVFQTTPSGTEILIAMVGACYYLGSRGEVAQALREADHAQQAE